MPRLWMLLLRPIKRIKLQFIPAFPNHRLQRQAMIRPAPVDSRSQYSTKRQGCDSTVGYENHRLVMKNVWLIILAFLLLSMPLVAEAQFLYTTNNGTITIARYTNSGGDVIIPTSINGLPVTRIGNDAFILNTNVISVTIPDGVTNIDGGAFSECPNLNHVAIPDSVTSIGEVAFFGSASLTNVNIPGSVTSIGDKAFLSCWSLTEISVDPLNSVYGTLDGALFDKRRTTLIQCPIAKTGAYTISDCVTCIGTFCFYSCSALTNITIPGTVTNIGQYAFDFCTALPSITIGSGVTSIADDAFDSCYGLITVTVPGSVTNIGDEAFVNCIRLEGAYFQGSAPSNDSTAFASDYNSRVYYLPGSGGWTADFGSRPTVPWALPYPVILNFGSSFGIQTNQFGFVISWATNLSVVVQACTSLENPSWQPVGTNTFVGGSSYFSDPRWTNFPRRFYRVATP
jgi:hypothetical protein